jgi:hypothetical protein
MNHQTSPYFLSFVIHVISIITCYRMICSSNNESPYYDTRKSYHGPSHNMTLTITKQLCRHPISSGYTSNVYSSHSRVTLQCLFIPATGFITKLPPVQAGVFSNRQGHNTARQCSLLSVTYGENWPYVATMISYILLPSHHYPATYSSSITSTHFLSWTSYCSAHFGYLK